MSPLHPSRPGRLGPSCLVAEAAELRNRPRIARKGNTHVFVARRTGGQTSSARQSHDSPAQAGRNVRDNVFTSSARTATEAAGAGRHACSWPPPRAAAAEHGSSGKARRGEGKFAYRNSTTAEPPDGPAAVCVKAQHAAEATGLLGPEHWSTLRPKWACRPAAQSIQVSPARSPPRRGGACPLEGAGDCGASTLGPCRRTRAPAR